MLTRLPTDIKDKIEEVYRQQNGLSLAINKLTKVTGGCINQCGCVETNRGNFFIKWNEKAHLPGMFEAEAYGLRLMRNTSAISIPQVIFHDTTDRYAFIVMEYMQRELRGARYWTQLGEQLAAMHLHTTDQFGLDHDNYIGTLPQHNQWVDDWIDFFDVNRISPMLKYATDNGYFSSKHIRQWERLRDRLSSIFPSDEKPALIHGDLWSGNVIDNNGVPCLVDPATYYGNREMEIAMTGLFGGFDKQFYEAYFDAFPVAHGFWEREKVYNLHPLLVHVNLFGQGYVGQVEAVLNKFGS